MKIRHLNTDDWATSANLDTRNSDQAKTLRTKSETRMTTSIQFIRPKTLRKNHHVMILVIRVAISLFPALINVLVLP